MAEEFQAGICGGNWWNSSKTVFMGGCSTVNTSDHHMGTYGSSWVTDMVDLKAKSCKESNNSVSHTTMVFQNSHKPHQQTDSDSGGNSILMDSATLQMMGFGLSASSSSSSDWSQALL